MAKRGAPFNNKNAAGPHDGPGGFGMMAGGALVGGALKTAYLAGQSGTLRKFSNTLRNNIDMATASNKLIRNTSAIIGTGTGLLTGSPIKGLITGIGTAVHLSENRSTARSALKALGGNIGKSAAVGAAAGAVGYAAYRGYKSMTAPNPKARKR